MAGDFSVILSSSQGCSDIRFPGNISDDDKNKRKESRPKEGTQHISE